VFVCACVCARELVRVCLCVGIARHKTSGTLLFLTTFDWDLYRDCLRNILSQLLQDVDVDARIHVWFISDGSLPCFLVEFGNNIFPKQWIESFTDSIQLCYFTSVFIQLNLPYTTYIMIIQKAKKATCFDCKQSSSGLTQYFRKLQC
jgi:hypothetical protein